MKRVRGIIFVIALVMLLTSQVYAQNDVSTLGCRFTEKKSEVVISGMFFNTNDEEVVDYGFKYGLDKNNLKTISVKSATSKSGHMSYRLTGLEEDKQYHYVAYKKYKDRTEEGMSNSFYTSFAFDSNGNAIGNNNNYHNHNNSYNNGWNNYNNYSNMNNYYTNPNKVNTFGCRFTEKKSEVIISGMFSDIQSSNIEDYGFMYGLDSNNLKTISLKATNKKNGFMDYRLTNLLEDKRYYYKSFIKYTNETKSGNLNSFVTSFAFNTNGQGMNTYSNNWNNQNGFQWSNMDRVIAADKVSTLGFEISNDKSTATIKGRFNDLANSKVTDYGFMISPDKEYFKEISLEGSTPLEGILEYKLTDLKDKQYYYKAYIRYTDNLIEGKCLPLETNIKVITNGYRYTNMEMNQVVISGWFKDIENKDVVDYGFMISVDNGEYKNVSLKKTTSKNGAADYMIKNLLSNKKYQYKAYIKYKNEMREGQVISFYTY